MPPRLGCLREGGDFSHLMLTKAERLSCTCMPTTHVTETGLLDMSHRFKESRLVLKL